MEITFELALEIARSGETVKFVMNLLRFVPKTGGLAESENDADKSGDHKATNANRIKDLAVTSSLTRI
jgi:hypothetical protein